MYTINDIQVFVPTLNRPKFLRESLNSLVNQTAGIPQIVVYNNGTLSETSKVIKEFAKYGVTELKSKGGLIECMENANITSPYVMFFHDDDIVHKNYLEYALKALNTYENIAFITTRTKNFTNEKTIDFENISDEHYLFSTQEQFADYMYLFERIAMQTAIYKTELFKKFPRETDKYGKFFDWPYLVTLSGQGNVVLFSHENMFNVRIHSQQWTFDINTSWKINELINWHKQFYDAMNVKDFDSLGHIIFYAKFKKFILSGYYGLVCEKYRNKCPENIFLQDAITKLSINTKDIVYNQTWIVDLLHKKIYHNFCEQVGNTSNQQNKFSVLSLLVQENEFLYFQIIDINEQLNALKNKSKTQILQKIFSVKNSANKKHKILSILGIKIKLKRNFYFLKKSQKIISSDYNNAKRTYIIWAPEYDHSNGIRALYTLCNELQKKGYDAYMWVNGKHLPQFKYVDKITKKLRENAIVVYPEVVSGNPLNIRNVVRWVLYKPGVIGGDTSYASNEIIFSWLKEYYNAPLLQVLHLNHELFYEDPSVKKDIDSYFVYKGGQCRSFPELNHAVKITYNWPEKREDLVNLLRRTKTLYSFDLHSALNDEALLCGAKVKLVTQDGFINHESIEEISQKEFNEQLDNFIRITQNYYCPPSKSFIDFKRFIENFFSIKNSKDKKHKVITILGIKFKFKRKKEGKK